MIATVGRIVICLCYVLAGRFYSPQGWLARLALFFLCLCYLPFIFSNLDSCVDTKLRDLFDCHLEEVLAELPKSVHGLLAEVPLHVEDYPSQQVIHELGLTAESNLCGMYSGVPLDQRTIDDRPSLPDVVTIYREGIIRLAAGNAEGLSSEELRRQIRITLLHELGHHHGLSESDLEQLGYD